MSFNLLIEIVKLSSILPPIKNNNILKATLQHTWMRRLLCIKSTGQRPLMVNNYANVLLLG